MLIIVVISCWLQSQDYSSFRDDYKGNFLFQCISVLLHDSFVSVHCLDWWSRHSLCYIKFLIRFDIFQGFKLRKIIIIIIPRKHAQVSWACVGCIYKCAISVLSRWGECIVAQLADAVMWFLCCLDEVNVSWLSWLMPSCDFCAV